MLFPLTLPREPDPNDIDLCLGIHVLYSFPGGLI